MTDYKSLYFSLYNAVSDALEILEDAQIAGENAYSESSDDRPLLTLLQPENKEQADNPPILQNRFLTLKG